PPRFRLDAQAAPAHARKPQQHGRDRNQDRDRRDVEEPEPALELLDVLAQAQLHAAQVPADLEELRLELFDLLELRRAQDHLVALAAAGRLELGQLALRLLAPFLQLALLGAQVELRLALQVLDQDEG